MNQVCAIIDETFSDICEMQNAKINENDRWSKSTKERKTDVFVTQHSKIGRYYTKHESQII